MNSNLVNAMADLDEDAVLSEVKELQAQNDSAPDIIAGLQEGMAIVGKRFEEVG